jgi:hypothetical protein
MQLSQNPEKSHYVILTPVLTKHIIETCDPTLFNFEHVHVFYHEINFCLLNRLYLQSYL